MKCKLCNCEKKLIRAHIIPEGFFRRLRDGQDPPRILTECNFPKKAPIGVYDSTILCGDCERVFGDWDNHGQQILAAAPIGEPIEQGGKVIAYKIEKFNYDQLKLFFVSLLWRASVSTHPFYKKINLGPYEEIAKNKILNSDAGSNEEFSITISKFGEHPFHTTTLDPHKEKWRGINYYRFYMASYIIYIKVDKRPAPPPFDEFMVSIGKPIYIICRDLSKSKELPLIQKVGRSAKRRVTRPA